MQDRLSDLKVQAYSGLSPEIYMGDHDMEAAILRESVRTFPWGNPTPDPREHKGEKLGLEVLSEG